MPLKFNQENTSTHSNNTSSDSSEIQFLTNLNDEYTVIRELGSGTYGKSVLVRCHLTNKCMALKLMKRCRTQYVDFRREFNLSQYLSVHSSIVNTYEYVFQTPSKYGFAQELAPYGDLFEFIQPQVGLKERYVKLIVTQVVSALDFMHSRNLVHRDIKPENILVFETNFSVIKLTDFGMTRDVGTLVKKLSDGIPYTPPEISGADNGVIYKVKPAADVWALGVLIFAILTGNFPWEVAHPKDLHFVSYLNYRSEPSSESPPPQFQRIGSRLLELFDKMFAPEPRNRCPVVEVCQYLSEEWLQVCDKFEESMGTSSGSSDISTDASCDGACGQVQLKSSPKSKDSSKFRAASGIENFLKKFKQRTKFSIKSHEERFHIWLLKSSSCTGSPPGDEMLYEQ